MAVAPVGLILRMFVCILFFADLGSRWVPRPRPLCGCGPLVGLMWLVFFVRLPLCAEIDGGVALGPCVVVDPLCD